MCLVIAGLTWMWYDDRLTWDMLAFDSIPRPAVPDGAVPPVDALATAKEAISGDPVQDTGEGTSEAPGPSQSGEVTPIAQNEALSTAESATQTAELGEPVAPGADGPNTANQGDPEAPVTLPGSISVPRTRVSSEPLSTEREQGTSPIAAKPNQTNALPKMSAYPPNEVMRANGAVIPNVSYSGYFHSPKKNVVLQAKPFLISCEISISKPGHPNFFLCWRLDADAYQYLKMQQRGKEYVAQIPATEMRPGMLEYYFSLSLPGDEIQFGDETYKNFKVQLEETKTVNQ